MIDSKNTSAPESLADDEAIDQLAGVRAPLAAAMRRRGFESLTSVQQAVLAADASGRDLRISSQTGSGKTVAIGLALASGLADDVTPAARKGQGPSVLVLVPTRELAMQVRDELCWLFEGIGRLRVEVVMGGTSVGLERRALAKKPQVVVGTPGRALDHLKTGALTSDGVEHVVLDEADRMLDMGFRDELEAILEKLPVERRTHLVSATFPSAVRKLADRFQRDSLHIEGTRLGAANSDIEHVAHVVNSRDRHAALVNLLLLNEGGRCLIFVERRTETTALAEKLSAHGFPVQAFSGELAQAQRTRTINAFRDGTMKTLVSTDVAARGIDVPDIELVVHMDIPDDADSYVHRSGRTGRAGRTGRSVSLVPPRARRGVERLLAAAHIQAEWAPVPNAAKVARHLRKQFRQQVHARLGADDSPTQQQIDYAKGLLDGRDPATVVALLLELAEPRPACEPMEVHDPAVDATPAGKEEGRGEGRGAKRGGAAGYVRFTINWGEHGGAAANRLLGHVCRRGDIRGSDVGAIEIRTEQSSFEVEASVAARFEKLVQKPDPRDPKLRITRDAAHAGVAPVASTERPQRVPRRPGFGPKERSGAKPIGKRSGKPSGKATGKPNGRPIGKTTGKQSARSSARPSAKPSSKPKPRERR